jgi:hypothetical protein
VHCAGGGARSHSNWLATFANKIIIAASVYVLRKRSRRLESKACAEQRKANASTNTAVGAKRKTERAREETFYGSSVSAHGIKLFCRYFIM